MKEKMYKIWDNLATCNLLESCTPEGWIIVDVRDLDDGKDNEVEQVKMKIMIVSNLMASGQKVVVRCLAGMSRSNTIACAAMMMMGNGRTWDHWWKKIEKACPRARQNLAFVDIVKKALLELGVDRDRMYYA
jgi:protein-tyrosine phosphatase